MAPEIQQNMYQYEQLSSETSIRLLTLINGEGDEELVFSLRNTELHTRDQAHSRHEALSYTWGDPTPKHSALCSGAYFPLGTSLHAALLSLRCLDRPRVLWIDAICINQNDLQERASQVSIMQQIYGEADRVVIWLGAEDDLTGTAMKAFERLYPLVEKAPRSTAMKAVHRAHKLLSGSPAPQMLMSSEELRSDHQITALESVALARLFQRPWFKRVWVVQEVVSAKRATVVCGTCSIEWEWLASVCDSDLFQSVSRVGASTMRAAPGILSVRREHRLRGADGRTGLLSLLSSTRGLDATDPRDKLFAVQHLARKEDPWPIVDYTVPVAVVYTQYAIQLLRTNSLDFLSAVDPSGMKSPSSMGDLPSWVPDWSHKPDLTNYPGEHLPLIESCNHFQASGSSAAMFTLSECSTVLTLRGATVGSVQVLGSDRWASTIWDDSFASLDFEFDMETSDGLETGGVADQQKVSMSLNEGRLKSVDDENLRWPIRGTDDERLQTLLEVLLCDTDALGKRIFPRRLKPPRPFVEAMIPSKAGTNVPLLHLPAFMQQPFYPSPLLSRIRIMSWGRRFFISDDGHFGWVPQHAEAGDVVVCFSGVRVLMLLRQRTDGAWTLVGECYLHGLMHGELFAMSQFEWKDFAIK